MINHQDHYTSIQPILSNLSVVRQARRAISGGLSAPLAMNDLFCKANVDLKTEGGIPGWCQAGAGILLIGDHRLGVEFAPLLALFGTWGRDDICFVAKPFASSVRLMSAMCGVQDMLLPVIPNTLARDAESIWNRDLGWRMLRRNSLPTKREIIGINSRTLRRSADVIAHGGLVTIFPTGAVNDALSRPWKEGIGSIVRLVPPRRRPDTQVVLFRFDDFAPGKLMRALALQSYGLTPRPSTITLRLSTPIPLSVLTGSDSPKRGTAITEELRYRFIAEFGSR